MVFTPRQRFLEQFRLQLLPSALPIPGLISLNKHGQAKLEICRNADLLLLCAPPAQAKKERKKEELPWWSFLWLPSSCSPHLTPAGRDRESDTGLQIPAALNPGAATSDSANSASGAACIHGFIAPLWLCIQSSWFPFCLSFIPANPHYIIVW